MRLYTIIALLILTAVVSIVTPYTVYAMIGLVIITALVTYEPKQHENSKGVA